jgi:hypothetical protein
MKCCYKKSRLCWFDGDDKLYWYSDVVEKLPARLVSKLKGACLIEDGICTESYGHLHKNASVQQRIKSGQTGTVLSKHDLRLLRTHMIATIEGIISKFGLVKPLGKPIPMACSPSRPPKNN